MTSQPLATQAARRLSPIERMLLRSAVTESGCWELSGVTTSGYGIVGVGSRQDRVYAHRLSYETFVGPIPDGLQIDHLCRRRHCVNPNHLEPVTAKENRRRAMKPLCANGHLWSDETTYVDKRGQRSCIPCMRQATQRWRAKRDSGIIRTTDI